MSDNPPPLVQDPQQALVTHDGPVDVDEDDDIELAVGTVVGEYHVERKVGAGGMATVYAAVHPLIGKRAAVKVMRRHLTANASAVKRFVQEARSVNQIGHPNIVDIFAFGQLPDQRSYFVMEWLAGEVLSARLPRGHLHSSEIIAILLQLCDALEAAHAEGIVHRDLKPENVFILDRGRYLHLKLLDFGIAKLVGTGSDVLRNTRTGTWVGTPCYMSPEQARGKAIDHRTDIYSLGVMAYEMFVGRLPFDGQSAADVVAMHLNSAPPPPHDFWPSIPPQLERALLQMLAKDAAGRPTVDQVRHLLTELRDDVELFTDQRAEELLRAPAQNEGVRKSVPVGKLTPIAVGRVSASGRTNPTPVPVAPAPLAAVASPSPSPSLQMSSPSLVLVKPQATGPQSVLIEPELIEAPIDEPIYEPSPPPPAARRRWLMPIITLVPAAVMLILAWNRQHRVVTPPPRSPPVVAVAAPELSPLTASVVAASSPSPQVLPGTLAIHLNSGDARVELDGAVVGESVQDLRLPVAQPGEHQLVISAPHRVTLRRSVTITAGATLDLNLRLERSPSEAKAKPSRPKNYMLDPFGR